VVQGHVPVSELPYGPTPVDTTILLVIAAIVGYARRFETGRIAATRLASSTQGQLDRLDTESQLLSRLSIEIGRSSTVESTLNAAHAAAVGQEHRIECSIPATELIVDCDPIRLAQVFTNLITNALKYSSKEQPVKVTVESDTEQVRISVSDRGLGISESDREKLFSPFFRSTNPEALQNTGTGLGLVLAKSIVEQHDGNLRVLSEFGYGSTFTVELPVAASDHEARAA
jgi:signal transduction histidine kinase